MIFILVSAHLVAVVGTPLLGAAVVRGNPPGLPGGDHSPPELHTPGQGVVDHNHTPGRGVADRNHAHTPGRGVADRILGRTY